MTARLVVIGDSLAQGLRSGSVFETQHAFPAVMARAMGIEDFRRPDFDGEGGFPVNLELLVRMLSGKYGKEILRMELPRAAMAVQSFMSRVEDHWERGPGTQATATGPIHHNLAVWGFQVGDSDTLTESACRRFMPPSRDDLLQQIPEHGRYRAARRTLNPSLSKAYGELTQLDLAQRLAQTEGGIENLVVTLGCNHCLPAALLLKLVWSDDAELYRFSHERRATIWTPRHFEAVWQRVAPKIDAVGAERVLVATVPHVTIAPVMRGVTPGSRPSQGKDADGYYEFYTHFWIWDGDFAVDPFRYPRLTREQVKLMDAVIDEYNETIHRIAAQRGWEVVDLCKALDRISFRRQGGLESDVMPGGLKRALKAHPGTADLYGARHPMIDTRYHHIRSGEPDPQKRCQGGFFSLDGIHPSVTGSALLAREFLEVIGGRELARSIDWDAVVRADRLLHDSPLLLGQLRSTLGFLASHGILQSLARSIGWSQPRS